MSDNGNRLEPQLLRAELLKQVLIAQKEIQKEKPHVELITNQELIAIQVVWHRDLSFDYKVSEIYNKVNNRVLDMKKNDEKIQKEIALQHLSRLW